MLIPLVIPHQQKYGFLLVLPMVAYMLYYFIILNTRDQLKNNKTALIFFILAMLFFSPLYGSEILGRHIFQFTQHYRLLTFATLTLMVLSISCSPDKLEKRIVRVELDSLREPVLKR
jgi:hypothetical protein